jgi:hypothetical protein
LGARAPLGRLCWCAHRSLPSTRPPMPQAAARCCWTCWARRRRRCWPTSRATSRCSSGRTPRPPAPRAPSWKMRWRSCGAGARWRAYCRTAQQATPRRRRTARWRRTARRRRRRASRGR